MDPIGAFFKSVHMHPQEYRIRPFLRIGHLIPCQDCFMRCNCGSDLDSYGYHLLTCKFGGEPSWQHNSVVST